jgi:hypothetical protein
LFEEDPYLETKGRIFSPNPIESGDCYTEFLRTVIFLLTVADDITEELRVDVSSKTWLCMRLLSTSSPP